MVLLLHCCVMGVKTSLSYIDVTEWCGDDHDADGEDARISSNSMFFLSIFCDENWDCNKEPSEDIFICLLELYKLTRWVWSLFLEKEMRYYYTYLAKLIHPQLTTDSPSKITWTVWCSKIVLGYNFTNRAYEPMTWQHGLWTCQLENMKERGKIMAKIVINFFCSHFIIKVRGIICWTWFLLTPPAELHGAQFIFDW